MPPDGATRIRDPSSIGYVYHPGAAYSGSRHYATERAIPCVAVKRNNWVFLGSDEGGRTAAVLRIFLASCHRVSVDPFAWMKDVLARIPGHLITKLAELLPHNWAPANA